MSRNTRTLRAPLFKLDRRNNVLKQNQIATLVEIINTFNQTYDDLMFSLMKTIEFNANFIYHTFQVKFFSIEADIRYPVITEFCETINISYTNVCCQNFTISDNSVKFVVSIKKK